jgi:TolA-binding protein
MPRRFWIAGLNIWPGLAQIWSGQDVLGVATAVVFAAFLNLAIATRAIWTEAAPAGSSTIFAAAAAFVWAGSLGYTVWWIWQRHPERHRDDIERLFRQANDDYLQGRYVDARRAFEAILDRDPADADALMRLGALFARTDQPSLARRMWRQCLELESGARWRWEIERGLARLGADVPAVS